MSVVALPSQRFAIKPASGRLAPLQHRQQLAHLGYPREPADQAIGGQGQAGAEGVLEQQAQQAGRPGHPGGESPGHPAGRHRRQQQQQGVAAPDAQGQPAEPAGQGPGEAQAGDQVHAHRGQHHAGGPEVEGRQLQPPGGGPAHQKPVEAGVHADAGHRPAEGGGAIAKGIEHPHQHIAGQVGRHADAIGHQQRRHQLGGSMVEGSAFVHQLDDPVLSQFGQVRLDLSMGMNHNLADLLSTLLQHDGLVSPYLDLSSDLLVALFFSSHKFVPSPNASTYRYVGNNGGKSILYIFRHDANEMADYAHDRVLHSLDPLRPKRQSCVICRSSPFALNLAGLYLVAAVQLNFEMPVLERLSASDLFLDSSEDTFLAALLENCQHADRITDFRHRRAGA